jgi:hypothetical protein
MMTKKSFLLLSLEDEKAKKVANVVSNTSCKKILDFLSTVDHATESEIAKKAKIPISTVHYNLQLLMDADLVNVEEFHYSKKGKEINHYMLANKYIIITPKKSDQKTETIKERLKKILPVVLITVAIAAVMQFFSFFISKSGTLARSAGPRLQSAANDFAAGGAEEAAKAALAEAAPVAEQVVAVESAPVIQTVSQTPIALWFLIGALAALVIYFVLGFIKRK